MAFELGGRTIVEIAVNVVSIFVFESRTKIR